MHDLQNPGIAVGVGESSTIIADDAALVDADAATATARVTALAAGSLTDAAMVISQAKSRVMHIHRKTHVSSTTEAEVEALKLAHKCDACSRTFPTQREMKIHNNIPTHQQPVGVGLHYQLPIWVDTSRLLASHNYNTPTAGRRGATLSATYLGGHLTFTSITQLQHTNSR